MHSQRFSAPPRRLLSILLYISGIYRRALIGQHVQQRRAPSAIREYANCEKARDPRVNHLFDSTADRRARVTIVGRRDVLIE